MTSRRGVSASNLFEWLVYWWDVVCRNKCWRVVWGEGQSLSYERWVPRGLARSWAGVGSTPCTIEYKHNPEPMRTVKEVWL